MTPAIAYWTWVREPIGQVLHAAPGICPCCGLEIHGRPQTELVVCVCGSQLQWTEIEPAAADAPPLHLVRKGEYPRALCGANVEDDWNPNRRDTAGRDRCTACLEVARNLRMRRTP